jgi:SAM-dependent methyltransferase
VSNPADADGVIQQVRFELYSDNIEGALQVLQGALATRPDPRYQAEVDKIQAWLSHLESREAYAGAYERYYRGARAVTGLKRLERRLRTLIGRKTRKMVAHTAEHPEFKLLEQEVVALRSTRVLDAGSGEGRVALALGARHPGIRVEGIEVAATNIGIARRLNRFPNVAFHQGFIEELDRFVAPGAFDLAYSFGVLEHVQDLDEVMEAIVKRLRPGGRFCFVVPMNELRATGPIPEFVPDEDMLGHIRVFTEAGLRERFGRRPGFFLHKMPGRWRPGRLPDCFVPVQYGSFFGGFSKA